MHLWEQGRSTSTLPRTTTSPASVCVRHDRNSSRRPCATCSHAGVGYWRRLSDLLSPVSGAGIEARHPQPLGEYYRRGLPQEVQPGTKWVYSNHGFAALGQVVEDVSGQCLRDYLREHVFDPVGMEHTDLVRSETGAARTRERLPRAVPRTRPRARQGDPHARRRRPLLDRGRRGSLRGLPADGGSGRHDRILQPSTVAQMFSPNYQPDPRLPGMGLGFDLGAEDGTAPSGRPAWCRASSPALTMAPSAGIGVVALSNTGGLSGQGAPTEAGTALLRQLIGLPEDQAARRRPTPTGRLGRAVRLVRAPAGPGDEPLRPDGRRRRGRRRRAPAGPQGAHRSPPCATV